MKKVYVLLTFLLLASVGFSQSQTYNGNGNTDFDGSIGLGSLNIHFDGTNLIFTLTKGGDMTVDFNDVLVIYIDNGLSGGFNSTTAFTDVSSGLAQAITGEQGSNPTNHGILTFPTGFKAQYALAFAPNNSQGAVLDSLNTGPYSTITSPTLSNNGITDSTTYSVSITPQQIGLDPTNFTFNFIGTYVSNSGYRSAEAFGINIPQNSDIAWNNYTDTSAALVFTFGTEAVNFGAFNGVAKNNIVDLNWSTKSESDLSQFQVLKSTDAASWNMIGTVAAKNIITGAQYSFVDNNATANKNYYRLKMVNKDGSFTYSGVLLVNKNGVHNISILGNPVTSNINLNISDDNASAYNLSLYSSDGKILNTQVFNHPGGTSKVTMNVPSSAKGICLLKVTNGTTTQTFRVLVQ